MYFSASGRPEKTSLIEVVGAVASALFYFTLIPSLGVAGAAIGTSLAYIVVAIVAVVFFRRDTDPVGSLFRTTGADLAWATGLIRDSLVIWGQKIRGGNTKG